MSKATFLLGQGKLWRYQEALFALRTRPAAYGARWLITLLCHAVWERAWGLSLAACAQCVGQASAQPSYRGTGPGLVSLAESQGIARLIRHPGLNSLSVLDWLRGVRTHIQPLNLHYCLGLCQWLLLFQAVVAFRVSETPKCLLI